MRPTDVTTPLEPIERFAAAYSVTHTLRGTYYATFPEFLMSRPQPRPDQLVAPAPFNGTPATLDEWHAKHGNGPRYEFVSNAVWIDAALNEYKGAKNAIDPSTGKSPLTDPLPDGVIAEAELQLAAFNAPEAPAPIHIDPAPAVVATPAPAILPIPAASAPVEHHASFWASVFGFLGHAAKTTGNSLTNPAVIAAIGAFVPAQYQPEVAIAEGIAAAAHGSNASPASLGLT